MTYPIGTPVHTYLVEATDTDEVTATVVIVYRATDGAVVTTTCPDHRTAQVHCDLLDGMGADVLLVVEGEHNLTTGQVSAWH